MNILDKIVSYKKEEVAIKKTSFPISTLESSISFSAPCRSLSQSIIEKSNFGLITEFKRQSPSKGIINAQALPQEVSQGYVSAGASAISVLTDEKFFGGKNEDLKQVRKFNDCPILRKEFIIDEYQIYEAKSIGADAILLIASILSTQEIKTFSKLAKKLGLEVLLEVHDEDEIMKYSSDINLIGVNNRNLKTFNTDFNYSKAIFKKLPQDAVKISESGINAPEIVLDLIQTGYKGFLIGEFFMKHEHPEKACTEFINKLNLIISKSNSSYHVN